MHLDGDVWVLVRLGKPDNKICTLMKLPGRAASVVASMLIASMVIGWLLLRNVRHDQAVKTAGGAAGSGGRRDPGAGLNGGGGIRNALLEAGVDPMPGLGLPVIPSDPSDSDLAFSRAFPRALLPVDEKGGSDDVGLQNRQMAGFVRAYRAAEREEGWRLLQEYLDGGRAPARWRSALELELAEGLFGRGYFDQGREVAEELWGRLRERRDTSGAALAEEALALALRVAIGRGDAAGLRRLLVQTEGRESLGARDGVRMRAQQSLWLLEHMGAENIVCGPRALNAVLEHEGLEGAPLRLDQVTGDYIETGLPMTELLAFAEKAGWKARAIRRVDPGVPVPTPAIMHEKAGHFSAVLATEGDGERYFLVDRGMGFAGWVGREALEAVSSGHFVVAAGGQLGGFEEVTSREAGGLYGRDGAHGLGSDDEAVDEPVTAGGGCSGPGMAWYQLIPQLGAVRISDTPVGYKPPMGPQVWFTIGYTDLDSGSPVAAPHSNLGTLWAMDWVSWVDVPLGTLKTDSPLRLRGGLGGTRVLKYNMTRREFGPHDRHFTTARAVSATRYEVKHPDGSVEVFDLPDNPLKVTRLYRTQLVDPQGQVLRFTFDSLLRLTQVTDSVGQSSSIFHESTNAALKMRVTRVKDPFGREARLAYSDSGLLTNITDSIGLSSGFSYGGTIAGGKSLVIDRMWTPYGATRFERSGGGTEWNRTLKVTDPVGQQEMVQYVEPAVGIAGAHAPPRTVLVGGKPISFHAESGRLQFRNSYYWGKIAMATAPGDVRSARNYRWYTSAANWQVQPVLEAVKEPLEDRVWFNYPGAAGAQESSDQRLPNYPGRGARPEKVLRMLSDGTPQLHQARYNALGLPVRLVDPVGRTTEFRYATNGMDLEEVHQLEGAARQRLMKVTYDARHRPTVAVDASGQTNRFAYNDRGQLRTSTDALGNVTTLNYRTNGTLESIDGPLAGVGDLTRFTHDAVGRVETVTEPDGYVVRYGYDALDRPTRVTFPDGTYEEFGYQYLDLITRRDRLGRTNRFEYNALRQVVRAIDPAQRVVSYDWCKCGDLRAVTDPMGRTTRWMHDVQGRLVGKEYVDGSKLTYVYEPQTSRLARRIDEKGQTTLYRYNLDDTLESVAYPDAKVPTPTVSFTYDPVFRRVTTMRDGIGETRYTYHAVTGGLTRGAGQVATVDGPWANDEIGYEYDAVGRLVGQSIGGAVNREALQLDPAGRIQSITNLLGRLTFGYVTNTTRLQSVTHSTGLRTEYDWFPNAQDRRLKRIRHLKPGGSVALAVMDYTYDATGRLLTWRQEEDADAARARLWTFQYDQADQLTNAVAGRGSQILDRQSWVYDGAGNRISETMNGVSRAASYNSLNQIVSTDLQLGAATYEWDAENRLVAVQKGGARTEFGYDGLGRRIRVSELGDGRAAAVQTYLWDGYAIREGRDASGAVVQRRFVSGGFLESLAGRTSGYLQTVDHLGSIRETLDVSGALKERISYDPWGNAASSAAVPISTFGFTGHLWHRGSGLHLALFRAYDSATARWISKDPIAEDGGINLYAYVVNSPLLLFDPTGLYPAAIPGPTPTATATPAASSGSSFPISDPNTIINFMPVVTPIPTVDPWFDPAFGNSPSLDGELAQVITWGDGPCCGSGYDCANPLNPRRNHNSEQNRLCIIHDETLTRCGIGAFDPGSGAIHQGLTKSPYLGMRLTFNLMTWYFSPRPIGVRTPAIRNPFYPDPLHPWRPAPIQ